MPGAELGAAVVASCSMLRVAQLLVLALLPALGTASPAAALTAKTALRAVGEFSLPRVTLEHSQRRELHQQNACSYDELASDSPLAPGAGAKTVQEAGADLAAQAGRNRVSARTAGGKQVDIDLAGKAHFDKASGQRVPTPHVQESTINVGPNGRTNLSDRTVRPATMDDIRTARQLLEREP